MPKKNKHSKDKGGSNLGRAIIRQQFPTAARGGIEPEMETERGKHKLRSVTQCDDLEEMMTHVRLLAQPHPLQLYAPTGCGVLGRHGWQAQNSLHVAARLSC